MKAMILAAGRGKRLRPITDHTPKPMINVRGKPLLEHQIGWLSAAGIQSLVINLHHLGEQIEAYFGDGRGHGVEISYSHESELLDTGGGIVKALPLLGSEPFLIVNGDIYTDFPFDQLSALPAWANIHLVVTPKPEFRQTGDFEFNGTRITARGKGYVYCGICILRPTLFETDRAEPFSLREHFFKAISSRTISAQNWPGYWIDIGNQAQLNAVNQTDNPDSPR